MNVTQLCGLLSAGLLAQSSATPPIGGDAHMSAQSVWEFVIKGGPMMIPIGLCSLVALAVFTERMASLRRSRIIPAGFMNGLKGLLRDVDEDREQALSYCEKDASPLAAIVSAGIKRLGRSVDVVEKYVRDAGEREVFKLRKHMRILAVIASISTLLGLLGTITGMITAFQTVAASADAMGKTELLAKGIYQAMITTAAGLMVAIPVVLAYNWLASRIDGLVNEMDAIAVEFVEEFAELPETRRAAADEPEDIRFNPKAAAAVGG
ncbi:MAG: MotA/TolQ/ExbB proton channel family protein [Planctomycetia bacterium]|nr:MotA/TolQ/ExbB proton channel family protein [Planctomycetia bacterium]MCC7315056.1 MotA/TolQ/ExbB proton channel family protein [Planctomycetota bacterium]OQY98905.1 MAG: hypothetical protein B6D36_16965 [Planctomycetes bacterium UTPLA1]